jgi:ketosteroid isomerase-like protein
MTDHVEIADVAARFYVALNALFKGDVRPMVEAWSHADDVTYMGPDGGFQIGWKDVLANWDKQAAMKLGGRVEPEGMCIAAGRNLAVTHNYEKGANTNTGGAPGVVLIRATNLFRKENGAWKMIGHHTDKLPYLSADTR